MVSTENFLARLSFARTGNSILDQQLPFCRHHGLRLRIRPFAAVHTGRHPPPGRSLLEAPPRRHPRGGGHGQPRAARPPRRRRRRVALAPPLRGCRCSSPHSGSCLCANGSSSGLTKTGGDCRNSGTITITSDSRERPMDTANLSCAQAQEAFRKYVDGFCFVTLRLGCKCTCVILHSMELCSVSHFHLKCTCVNCHPPFHGTV